MPVKFHPQTVLFFQYDFIPILPIRLTPLLFQERFQPVPSMADYNVNIPMTPMQRFRIPGTHRRTFEYRSRYAGIDQSFDPRLSPLGDVPVGLLQKEQMGNPLVPQAFVRACFALRYPVDEQPRYPLAMRHTEQLLPFIRRYGPPDALLPVSPQAQADELEKETLPVIRPQIHASVWL